MELSAVCPVPDPLDLLAFWPAKPKPWAWPPAALVLPHHPVVLAKRVASVDALSGGRLRLSVGMGWMKEEVEACGASFDSRGRHATKTSSDARVVGGPAERGQFPRRVLPIRPCHVLSQAGRGIGNADPSCAPRGPAALAVGGIGAGDQRVIVRCVGPVS